VWVSTPHTEPDTDATAGSPEHERAVAAGALRQVAATLRERGRRSAAAEAILQAQAMMAEDPVLLARLQSYVDDGRTAAQAVHLAFVSFRGTLTGVGRESDLEDVRRRAVAACQGDSPAGAPLVAYPHVVVAIDFSPADLASLGESVIGVVTAQGGPTSHTAILARAMGIPAVTGWAGAMALKDGDVVTVDDAARVVHMGVRHVYTRPVSPDASPVTSGPGVLLQANISSAADVARAVSAGAQGVGLLRTEFMTGYREVLDAFGAGSVVIRVFDASSDKPLPFLRSGHEPNPALGVRGLRALRHHPDVLTTQLRAIADAGGTRVLAPMVIDDVDARWFAVQARSFGLRPGAMIEVPSAALLVREILGEVDFVSIGTNDLVQYTLAADRQLAAMAQRQNPWHPAVLRLIAQVGEAANEAGKPAGVCGEAAADPALASVLIGLGMTSLSMTPQAIPQIRTALAPHTLESCRQLAREAMGTRPSA
jgi:phosphotransferase system enzyme I (PtsI)